MQANRIEIRHFRPLLKFRIGFLSVLFLLGLIPAIGGESIFASILCFGIFVFMVIEIAKLFEKKPVIVLDTEGISDSRWTARGLRWNEIAKAEEKRSKKTAWIEILLHVQSTLDPKLAADLGSPEARTILTNDIGISASALAGLIQALADADSAERPAILTEAQRLLGQS